MVKLEIVLKNTQIYPRYVDTTCLMVISIVSFSVFFFLFIYLQQ